MAASAAGNVTASILPTVLHPAATETAWSFKAAGAASRARAHCDPAADQATQRACPQIYRNRPKGKAFGKMAKHEMQAKRDRQERW
jgi:hypothetical protein